MTFDDLKKELLKNIDLFDQKQLTSFSFFKNVKEKELISITEIINNLENYPIKILYYFINKMGTEMDVRFSSKEDGS